MQNCIIMTETRLDPLEIFEHGRLQLLLQNNKSILEFTPKTHVKWVDLYYTIHQNNTKTSRSVKMKLINDKWIYDELDSLDMNALFHCKLTYYDNSAQDAKESYFMNVKNK